MATITFPLGADQSVLVFKFVSFPFFFLFFPSLPFFSLPSFSLKFLCISSTHILPFLTFISSFRDGDFEIPEQTLNALVGKGVVTTNEKEKEKFPLVISLSKTPFSGGFVGKALDLTLPGMSLFGLCLWGRW